MRKWILTATSSASLVVCVVSGLFAFRGISLHYACYNNTLQSAYEVAVETDGDLPFMVMFAISALLAAASAVCLGVLIASRKATARKSTATLVLLCACAANLIVGLIFLAPTISYMQEELEKAEALLPRDYLDNEWLQEMSLDELESFFYASSEEDDEFPVYIGREGCPECEHLEEKLTPLLSSEDIETVLPTYYTSEDRDGPRSEEMYELLNRIKVTSVPVMLVVFNGKILARWDDPVNEIDQIEKYLKTGELP